jgi:ribosome biogenesis protein Nip4
MGGVHRMHERDKNAYKILVRRPRCRWEDNIRMDLREIGCEGADWIRLMQERDQWHALVNMVTNLQVP